MRIKVLHRKPTRTVKTVRPKKVEAEFSDGSRAQLWGDKIYLSQGIESIAAPIAELKEFIKLVEETK